MRTIIATGGHSGLGYAAISALIKNPPPTLPPPYHLVLFARKAADHHAVRAVDELSANALASAPGSKIELRSMDLASLPSVRSAARQLKEELSARKQRIDVLFLNAAVAKAQRELVTDPEHRNSSAQEARTDGNGRYEVTACVNHVAHLVLIKELLPHLQSQPSAPTDSPQKALRIIFTGSALHRSLRDPTELDKWFSPASDPKDWSLRTTYAASKFLQLLGVQALQRRLRSIALLLGPTEVVIVQPGFVPQTALNRESGTFARFIMGYLFPVLPFGFIESMDGAANTMAQAMSRPLSDFPADEQAKGRDGKPLSPLGGDEAWIPPHLDDGRTQSSDHVQAALIARGGILQRPDDRSRDVELQDKWWPSAAEWGARGA